MYGGNDDYPYYLQNRTDENGNDLPIGPISYMENPEVPQANAYMLEAATNAVKEVASLGVDAQAANGQVAFDTVNQLNMRADLETMQLTFSGSVPDTLVSSRNSATTTDNILLATFFSVDKDGFLATNGSTLTIQSNGAAFTATTIKIIAEQ